MTSCESSWGSNSTYSYTSEHSTPKLCQESCPGFRFQSRRQCPGQIQRAHRRCSGNEDHAGRDQTTICYNSFTLLTCSGRSVQHYEFLCRLCGLSGASGMSLLQIMDQVLIQLLIQVDTTVFGAISPAVTSNYLRCSGRAHQEPWKPYVLDN